MKVFAIAAIFGINALINLTTATPLKTQARPAEHAPPSTTQVEKLVKSSLRSMRKFTSAAGSVELKYPENWEEIEPSSGPIIWKARALHGLVSARLGIDPLPPDTTIETYARATIEAVKRNMEQQHMPITLIEESHTTVSSLPAVKTVYTYQLAGTSSTAKVLQILVVRGNKGYVFNYTAQHQLFDDFLDIIQSIVQSIQIFEQNGKTIQAHSGS